LGYGKPPPLIPCYVTTLSNNLADLSKEQPTFVEREVVAAIASHSNLIMLLSSPSISPYPRSKIEKIKRG